MYICIGVRKHHVLKFLNTEGCGVSSNIDTQNGNCPRCGGHLVPETLLNAWEEEGALEYKNDKMKIK